MSGFLQNYPARLKIRRFEVNDHFVLCIADFECKSNFDSDS